mmetsp:Transcript_86513/g.149698  ORF Transcript_86513/g.149698 Transcript_86513/m.149698 type:complete len:268 (-) Transcript_86513:66-869(-)
MNSLRFPSNHAAHVQQKSVWYLCTFILLQNAGVVRAMGRSLVPRADIQVKAVNAFLPSQATARGLGTGEAHSSGEDFFLSGGPFWQKASFWQTPPTVGSPALRGASPNDSGHVHQQRHGQAPKFELGALYWRRSLKMPMFINFLSGGSQMWAILVSLVLVFWVCQAVKHGLSSLPSFTELLGQNPVQVFAHRMRERLQVSTRPPPHSEQMQCLISELEVLVREGGARLPQSLQKEKKTVTAQKYTPKVEQARELKAFGPYLEVAGEF